MHLNARVVQIFEIYELPFVSLNSVKHNLKPLHYTINFKLLNLIYMWFPSEGAPVYLSIVISLIP